jgi:glycosyltransferase involved in cell wall biosynthesis
MPGISVVIITLNEDQKIGRCLDSVQGLADEVIVLDSYSTDNTRQVCLEKGAKFYQHAFEGYIEQKNRVLSMASNDLVLSLDADEVLSDTLRKSILDVRDNALATGYTMNRLNNYCGKWIHHCGWYPDRKLRLVDKRYAKWEGLNPHDKLVLQKGKIMHLRGDLLHYSYDSIKGHMDQVNHFTDISAREMFAGGKRAPLWRLIFNPLFLFLKVFFLKLGFLDGYFGLVICVISTHATFLKYAKLRHLWKIS